MMKELKSEDAVDRILMQWRKEKPEFDLSAMEVLGRLKRCSALLTPKLEQVFSDNGLNFWEFDVLATLRRSGAPYCLTPTELFSTLMVTSGTMTHRMTQLEKKGWIERVSNEQDARSKLVCLSASGLALIDQVLEPHVENGLNLLSGLSPEEYRALNIGLKALLGQFES